MAHEDVTAQLHQFCNAIRSKEDWVFKILDENRGLAKKWVVEAGLDKNLDDVPRVDAAIEELKAEARRIQLVDYTIHLHSQNLPRRTIRFDAIDSDIRDALKYVRKSKYALRVPRLKDELGVYISDGVVPPSLHKELVDELNALAALEPKDFHPGTNGKVQDLIHPSLYPYIGNVSPIDKSSKMPPLQEGMFTSKLWTNWYLEFSSPYSWIPSVFHVSDDGTDVHIESYINGLGPRENFPNLYRIIEKVFLFALPHFERTLACEFQRKDTPSTRRWIERSSKRQGTTRSDWNAILAHQQGWKTRELAEEEVKIEELDNEALREWTNASEFFDTDDSEIATSYKGQKLKVIVKAANYVLLPGQDYEGTWHLEGMPHERIVASVIYYYDTDQAILDDGLCLRRVRDEEYDFPDVCEYNYESFKLHIIDEKTAQAQDDDVPYDSDEDYPSDWEDNANYNYIPLGTVPTTHSKGEAHKLTGHGTGRMLSFPNWLQHKVVGVKNGDPVLADNSQLPSAARRKILCFFLVQDDDGRNDIVNYPGFYYAGLKDLSVLTTQDVPPQGCATNIPTLHILLPLACKRLTGKNLPPEIIDHMVSLADLGLTREMAERHRRSFMQDRKVKAGDLNDELTADYSLCEH